MTADEILMDTEERMEKAVSVLQNDLRGLRTGRASAAMVDTLRVEYYGSPTPLKQMANVTAVDAQTLVIKPYDATVLKEIEKAIRASSLGLTPNNDGKLIRLIVPAMSGENRKKIVAELKKSAEATKVACRNIRRDGNKHFDVAEKDKEMTEDERDAGKEQVQALLKQYEGKVEEMEAKKTKEIMEA